MKIVLIHNNQAFLPELTAYETFFQTYQIETCSAIYGQESASDADVYWYMMGYYPKAYYKKKLIIHEYASASVPPYRKLKDFFKSKLNPRPHFRLFLNEYVKEQICIHDEVPFGYRDMGVAREFFQISDKGLKEFDFIYSGSLSAGRNMESLLRVFEKGELVKKSILILGKDECGLKEKFRHCRNIIFQSPVSWEQVPSWLSRARYAFNFVPNIEPFNSQTSTKFLEYAAMKIPVISTNYFWISEFQEKYNGNYFILKEDLSNLSWEKISGFPFEFPNLKSWSWEERIRASGVLEFLLHA
jgi:glycosyltransferase involved in cell wall biosynthesis